EKPFILGLGRAIKSVRRFFEAIAIFYRHASPTRGDETLSFIVLECDAYACAAHAQHQSEELVSENEFFCVNSILCHEKPPRQSLLEGAFGVRQGCITRLHEESVRE